MPALLWVLFRLRLAQNQLSNSIAPRLCGPIKAGFCTNVGNLSPPTTMPGTILGPFPSLRKAPLGCIGAKQQQSSVSCVCVCVFVGPCHPVYFVPPVESSLPCTHPQYSPFRPCLPFPRSQCPLFVDSHCNAYSMLPRVHSIGRVRLTFVVKCHLFMCSFPCFPRPICYPVFSSMLPMCLPFLPAPSTLSPFCFHRSSCECGLRFWQQRE